MPASQPIIVRSSPCRPVISINFAITKFHGTVISAEHYEADIRSFAEAVCYRRVTMGVRLQFQAVRVGFVVVQ